MSLPPVQFKSENADSSVAFVLDDDRDVGALVARMLRAAGFAAVPFTEPALCLKELKAAAPDATPKVIVLDLSLGKTDAVEVLDRLKTAQYQGRVLLISGKSESVLYEIQRMGTDRGIKMLPSLKKPFQINELKERLTFEPEAARPIRETAAAAAATLSLERAIADNRLHLWYQGRFDLRSNSLVGAEVILYTQDPSCGFVALTNSLPPSDSALHHPLSRLLLRTALTDWARHFSQLRPSPKLYMKLPLSVISTPGFLAVLRETLPPHPHFPGFVIEVSDWKVFNDEKMLQEVSALLMLYDVGLSVDDIGAVYSSIAQASRFPFVELKLGSRFVANCALNETKRSLCMDVINLAHSVGALVCAEGVADRDELRTLVGLKCDMVQGSVFGKPLPIEAFKAKLLGPAAPRNDRVPAATGDDQFMWPVNHVET